jgi:hypothetical protein
VKYAADLVLLTKEEKILHGVIYRLIEIARCYGMEMKVEKKKMLMRISRESSPVKIMIDQKQMETVEYFNCLGSTITNDARCTREIKSRIAMEKAAFNRKKILFNRNLDLNLKKKLVKCYIWSVTFYGAEISGSRSETPGKF